MTRSSISIEKQNEDVFEVTVVDSITTTHEVTMKNLMRVTVFMKLWILSLKETVQKDQNASH